MKPAVDQNDSVWRALSDATRREILDSISPGPITTGQLVERFEAICRTNVMKHLNVLVDAKLVVIRREGRVRWNYLNPVPIERICSRWVNRHVKLMSGAMSRLKDHLEDEPK